MTVAGTNAAAALREWKRRSDELDAERDALIRGAKAAGINIRQISAESGVSRPTIYKVLGEDSGADSKVIASLAVKALQSARFRELDDFWTETAEGETVAVLHWIPRDKGSTADYRRALVAVEALKEAGLWTGEPETCWSADAANLLARGEAAWIGL